ncbi:pyridoxamine 5'-phosphate oxidase family protein [Jiella sp. M17.18]|uniref:pyridoxamine 5'-phosphate oxidase family protein n=1 Tax=Jiella sp. M17.18 TaxID=3234247 RepID=UPI0034DFDBA3
MVAKNDVEQVFDLVEKIGFCMLATHEGQDIRSRPMAAQVDRDTGTVYFLTDVASHKDADIAANPNVNLAFADTSGQTYVSISGTAEISNDRAKIKELWGTPAKAWWESPDDPSIRVLKIDPKDAHYWNSPGTAVSYVKMLAAAVSNSRPDMGDNGTVKL